MECISCPEDFKEEDLNECACENKTLCGDCLGEECASCGYPMGPEFSCCMPKSCAMCHGAWCGNCWVDGYTLQILGHGIGGTEVCESCHESYS